MLQKLNKYYEEGLLYKQVHPTLPLTIWNYTEKVQYESLWVSDFHNGTFQAELNGKLGIIDKNNKM